MTGARWAFRLVLLGAFVVLLGTLAIDRFGAVDELGLYNPVYTWLETGRMTYPAHYDFERMVVHPPSHYLMIGLWMKLGVPLYYAEALPAILMHLLALVAIARAPFPWSVRVGLVTGLVAPIVIFHNSRLQVEWFGMRPEGELNAAWLAGLVLLESGRQRGWSFWHLFAGTVLLTFASTLHYYAVFSWVAAPIYVAWAFSRESRSVAWKAAAPVVAGGLLVGLPFLVFFVIPQFAAIRGMVDAVQSGGSGPLSAVREHFAQYAYWRTSQLLTKVPGPAVLTGLGLVFASGIPAIFWLPLNWINGREMRGILLGSLPLLLFLLLYAQRKHGLYYAHELTLASAGLVALALGALEWIAAKRQGRWTLVPAACASALGIALPILPPRVADLTFSLTPRVHEMEVARAAAVTTLGPRALVGGRTGSWYIGGGQHFYGVDPQIYWDGPLPDPLAFARRFDAFVEIYHMSDTSSTDGKGLSAWFASGSLHLRGFYLARRSNTTMSYVLLSAGSSSPIVGYANQGASLVRFTEEAGGTSVVVAARCHAAGAELMRQRTRFSVPLLVPPEKGAPSDALVTAVAENGLLIPEGCREIERHAGTVSVVSEASLLNAARSLDGPMRFYLTPESLPLSESASRR